ncbi:MAG: nucleotidyltransferase family protein [Kiritimatiellales bacterium]|nr:nucleotidyltransferase family protein [Kiritimatiellales bacterium]
MQGRQETIELLRQMMPVLRGEFGVKSLGIFGSVARDHPDADSDLDVLVEFGRPIGLRFVEFAEKLEQIVMRPVDVLTWAGLASIRQAEVAQSIKSSVIYV